MSMCKSVKNKIMYHIHKKEKFDEMWLVGNIIDNTNEDFINDFYNICLEFNDGVKFSDRRVPFEDVIDYYRNNKQYLNDEVIDHILEDTFMFLDEFNMLKRELALEEVRSKYYPEVISRKKAIWLCEKKQIKYWSNKLKSEHIIYKVKVNGKLFVSSGILLPRAMCSYYESLEKAHEYWKANLSNLDNESYEYLFEGKLEILEEIKL